MIFKAFTTYISKLKCFLLNFCFYQNIITYKAHLDALFSLKFLVTYLHYCIIFRT